MTNDEIKKKAENLQRELERLKSEQIRQEERIKIIRKDREELLGKLNRLVPGMDFSTMDLDLYVRSLEEEIENDIRQLEETLKSEK